MLAIETAWNSQHQGQVVTVVSPKALALLGTIVQLFWKNEGDTIPLFEPLWTIEVVFRVLVGQSK